uniref:Uncharacterized protein n=1 Tax=viral metagenome TaxID=1070528 RepID=A0A6C0AFC4_9ZZZZ
MEPRKWNQENGTKKMEPFGSREPEGSFGNSFLYLAYKIIFFLYFYILFYKFDLIIVTSIH